MAGFVIVDGKMLPVGKAAVSAVAPGLTTGMGVFTTMLAVDGEVRFFQQHYARLMANAQVLALAVPDADVIRQWVEMLVDQNRLRSGRARVRVSVYEGNDQPIVTVTAESTPDPAPTAKVANFGRVLNERSALAGVKCTSYAQNLLALREARAAGADEVLFVNTLGFVAEGATSNVFLVMEDGVVVTPSLASGCLSGVMRSVVIERLLAAGITCDERDVPEADLLNATGVFLTSSLRGFQPVSELSGQAMDMAAVEVVLAAVGRV